MSLVGTRPILQDELLKYELHHRARIAIKPGITGMWQVSGRSDITDFEEVVRLDTEYISNWNFGLDFYVNKLGFSVIRENYRPEREDWKLDLRVNEHTELEIFAEKNPPKRVNRPEACGLRHLAFCVDSVEQTVRELAEVGIECEPIRVDDYTGKKMTFFHDPDGLPLELHE